ncbi:hypothetical protein BDZ89DRAFT_1076742 [Hymenopellis radicata]|nr:hypothetical protein BDZ89DRAFT_1076742 [Hymenopellis radicata]
MLGILHDTSYYAKGMVGGVLACGITHAAMTPVDVAKCNMQVKPAKYTGIGYTIRLLLKEEGSTGRNSVALSDCASQHVVAVSRTSLSLKTIPPTNLHCLDAMPPPPESNSPPVPVP